jgi:hypothetical protein
MLIVAVLGLKKKIKLRRYFDFFSILKGRVEKHSCRVEDYYP